MARLHQFVATERLWAQAQQTRVAAIRTRISAAETFCTVAESAVHLHSLDQARHVMGKVDSAILEIERHIDEPHHVPATSIAQLRHLLDGLKDKAGRATALLTREADSQPPSLPDKFV